MTLISSQDFYLFNEGSHFELYRKLGAHAVERDGKIGIEFSVWAPNAEHVSVVCDTNGWNRDRHPLSPQGNSGIWSGFIPNLTSGEIYKYHIRSRYNGFQVDKADPFAFHTEVPPKTGSVVWDLAYDWKDAAWMKSRVAANSLGSPISIYEVHLGSWMRVPEEGDRSLTYKELAIRLTEYVKKMNFTHVEFMPVMEHPFFGSWGYQVTSFFAPTSRFGTPQEFMMLIDHLHQNGIGVYLDWVPSHFPQDEHGLMYFDGTHLYEHEDPRKGFHPDWKSAIFNYGRNEVRSFLISSALFWLDFYHADGLRVDGVASMLYLDYSRAEGEWIPNVNGGRENLEAISLLRRLNEEVFRRFPDAQTVAEESTAWPMVSRPTYLGGLGFGMKWDMGWMHDMLRFMAMDPLFRKYHQDDLTFRMIYAFNENFVLSLSHDEVVHGKGSLISKMAGWDWEKFANLRLLYGYMFGLPGKKLTFMGSEFGQGQEWSHDRSLDWHLLQVPQHEGVRRWMEDLNRAYRAEPALYEHDFEPAGFQWVDCNDAPNSTLSFVRRGRSETILVICNFTPVERNGYRLGVPEAGRWQEILNSDAEIYGGGGRGNKGGADTSDIPCHGQEQSLELTLPPLSALLFKKRVS